MSSRSASLEIKSLIVRRGVVTDPRLPLVQMPPVPYLGSVTNFSPKGPDTPGDPFVPDSGKNNRLVVFAGDIHGEWGLLATRLGRVARRHGPIDAVFTVGDAQPVRHDKELRMVRAPAHRLTLGDFPLVMKGEITMPAPVYFIGGNHEPYEALDAEGAGEWGPNVFYLGRSGVQTIAGLEVAFLSGVYSPVVSEERAERTGQKSRTYWTRSELRGLLDHPEPVDILLTHDWPDGAVPPNFRTPMGPGNEAVSELSRHLRPAVHAAGHRHRYFSAQVGPTKLLCLPDVLRSSASVIPFHVGVHNEMTDLSGPDLAQSSSADAGIGGLE